MVKVPKIGHRDKRRVERGVQVCQKRMRKNERMRMRKRKSKRKSRGYDNGMQDDAAGERERL
jgi:hypothetical protein